MSNPQEYVDFYKVMLSTGMFYEIFPGLSGSWEQDEAEFTRIYIKLFGAINQCSQEEF